ncbi:MAG: hypothetical protein ACFFB6_01015 [Promethearchaeota archaeon]
MSLITFTINIPSTTFPTLTRHYPHNIKNSATNDIIIIKSPEDKTYTTPMAGYYPATYGFENDEINNIPDEWENASNPNTDVKVVNGTGGHNKILYCYSSSSGSSYINLNNYPNPQVAGTIEFWLYKSSAYESGPAIVQFFGEGGRLSFINIDDNYRNSIRVRNGSSSVDIDVNYADDKWMHYQFMFNCTSDTFSLWVDRIQYLNNVDFEDSQDITYFNRTQITSFDAANPVLYYVDAIGYSWDPNYNVGNNLKEGLLLSFENKTILDWVGYSLDGQANKTILGNTTIPMPASGLHSIQIFGNDTLGTIHESEVRYFSIGIESNGGVIIIIVSVAGSIVVLIVVVFIFLRKRRGKIAAPKRFTVKSKRE